MRRRRAGVKWRNLAVAVDTTVNALLEAGLPRNQGAIARDMILLVAKYWGDKQFREGSKWSI